MSANSLDVTRLTNTRSYDHQGGTWHAWARMLIPHFGKHGVIVSGSMSHFLRGYNFPADRLCKDVDLIYTNENDHTAAGLAYAVDQADFMRACTGDIEDLGPNFSFADRPGQRVLANIQGIPADLFMIPDASYDIIAPFCVSTGVRVHNLEDSLVYKLYCSFPNHMRQRDMANLSVSERWQRFSLMSIAGGSPSKHAADLLRMHRTHYCDLGRIILKALRAPEGETWNNVWRHEAVEHYRRAARYTEGQSDV